MPPAPDSCARCGREVQVDWRLCPSCGAAVEGATRTRTGEPAPASSTSVDEGRFPAGTILAGRYRILGLQGRGGMGEVYRAFDQILSQAVALKFVAVENVDEATLARFRNEVRVARQVSHPNVCRVYDIGFVEGLHFLSMEYVDGEDLASLLRRIGRLPQDKALEFARKLCAGLSAAHERGVLHRDLKPSNIMIDGRGQVRITDFGLAAFSREIPLGDTRSGTPAYMSPEQKAGRDVTTRSDIYALGLVLHEMFTGRRRTDSGSSPSDLVKDLDPAIEQVILRCLQEDPRRRPATPLHVAMALPGGDPVAAALAAGDTPSPAMVAASEAQEGLSARAAVACVLVVVLSVVGSAALAPRNSLINRLPIPTPPEVLAFRAEEMLKALGYGDLPPHRAYGFVCCDQDAKAAAERLPASQRDARQARYRPPVLSFWYRRSPTVMGTYEDLMTAPGTVPLAIPGRLGPGEILMALDPTGRLVHLEVRPRTRGEIGTSGQDGWRPLFDAAGLDVDRLEAVAPQRVPPTAVDRHEAWTTSSAAGGSTRVEAALFEKRPVYFAFGTEGPPPGGPPGGPRGGVIATAMAITILLGCFVAVIVMARHNLKAGRNDFRGAAALAVVMTAVAMARWVMSATHVAQLEEIGFLLAALVQAVALAGLVWLFYVAVEPHLRRYWPEALISWTRLYAGRLRDPLVASHVLVGLTVGSVFDLLAVPGARAAFSDRLAAMDVGGQLASLPANLGVLTGVFYRSAGLGLMLLTFVVLVRLVSRRLWVADALGALTFTGLGGVGGMEPVVGRSLNFVACLCWLWLLRRLGLLAFLTAFAMFPLQFMPLVLTGWLAARSITLHLLPVVLAAVALWVIVGARPARPAEPA